MSLATEITHDDLVKALAKKGEIIQQEVTDKEVRIIAVITELACQVVRLLKISSDCITHIEAPKFAECYHLWHMAIGMFGELCELLDAVKKGAIYRKELDIANIIEELGDFEFYLTGYKQEANPGLTVDTLLTELYLLLDITKEEVVKGNFDKLSKRYANLSYSDSAAQERADKVE